MFKQFSCKSVNNSFIDKVILLSDSTFLTLTQFFFFSRLKIYKDSQFNNTKIKNSKIQVQNKTQTLRKSQTFLKKVCTHRGHINISNNNDNDNNNNNENNNNKIYIKKMKERKERERKREKNCRHIFEA